MGKTVKDQDYHNELCKELDLKTAKAALLMQEIQLLSYMKKDVEAGMTKAEIKERLEHNPFDDFDFFGNKRVKK